jgi:hypothetical protein
MHGYIGHTFRIVRAAKRDGKATSVEQDLKAEIESSGALEKVEEYGK